MRTHYCGPFLVVRGWSFVGGELLVNICFIILYQSVHMPEIVLGYIWCVWMRLCNWTGLIVHLDLFED